jgi:predicted DNA-binding transcriptional regulator AlpA
MIKVIRNLLGKIVDDIDAGNSNITEFEAEEVIELLRKYSSNQEGMSKYQAYTYLNMSRASFDNQVREGKLPKGTHVQGFKELRWYKKDLDKYRKSYKS